MGLRLIRIAKAAAVLSAGALLFVSGLASADEPAVPPPAPGSIRVATWAPDLTRKGPGLLLQDLRSGNDPQIAAAVQVIAAVKPDVLLLTDFDWDHDGLAIRAFADILRTAGLDYPHYHASQPNSGVASGLDLNGDGRFGTADDAQGFGQFTGQGGLAVLSRLPLGQPTDHSTRLWRDLPDNLMPPSSPEVASTQRLSSTAHWEVPVETAGGPLVLLAWSATPPVFDRGSGRNALRNHDEAAFWLHHLPDARFILIGDAKLDPVDGDGRPEALHALINSVQDPAPRSNGGAAAAQTGVNATHKGDPALDTAVYDASEAGNLRVDLALPSRDLKVTASGVFWPADGEALADEVAAASNHRLVWLDIDAR